MTEAISRLGEVAGTPAQRKQFLGDFAQALHLIELEEEADPGVLTVPRDRLASLTLSSLAEEPPEGSSFEALTTACPIPAEPWRISHAITRSANRSGDASR